MKGIIRPVSTGILFLVILFSVTLDAGVFDDGWKKLDPFLRNELKTEGFRDTYFKQHPAEDIESLAPAAFEETYHVVIAGDEEQLDNLPVHINTRHRGFVTARVTVDELREISMIDGIDYIEKGGHFQLYLDRSIPDIRINDVHSGLNIASPLKGKDVILGFIDTGIDFFHPDFRDADDPSRSRIISIWDWSLSPEGEEDHPENFNYGVEYRRANLEADLELGERTNVRTIDDNGHGTHIAGIAGGNGTQGLGRYTGVAPDAEYVVVRFDQLTTARVIDGMNYIFSIAEELGRPAVVNLSFGTHGGSHDGTSTMEQAVDQHAEWAGRAVTIAAGNSGNEQIHTAKTVARNQTESFSMTVDDYEPDVENTIIHQLWYEGTANAELEIQTPGGELVSTTTGTDRIEQTGDGLVEIIAPVIANAKGARLFAVFIEDFDDIPPSPGEWEFRFTPLTGERESKFNNWLAFSTMEDISMSPNTARRYTVSMPGTAHGGITVGAYTTKTTWTDRFGQGWQVRGTEGAIAPFSSGGPTRDGRLKPEIAAPGYVITSANSRDAQVPDFFTDAVDGYAIFGGTSMAAPHIMGVIALLFEQNPNLRTDQIIDILEHSGREDIRTGSIPNMTWGYGKIDAEFFAAASFRYVDAPEEFRLYQNYPNPFNPTTTIEFIISTESSVELIVYDVLGRKVDVLVDDILEPRHYIVNFDASNLSSGMYYYRLRAEGFNETRSMLHLK